MHTNLEKFSINVKTYLSYVNCKIIDPRKVDLKGAISLNVCVMNYKDELALVEAAGLGVQVKKEVVTNTVFIGSFSRVFTVREEVQIDNIKHFFGNIIRSDIKAVDGDFKIIHNKIIAKGEIFIRILYSLKDDSKKFKIFDYSIPVSHIIDFEGIKEDDICTLDFDIKSANIEPKQNMDEQINALNAEIVLEVMVVANKNKDISLIQDVYSTAYESSYSKKQIYCQKLAYDLNSNFSLTKIVDLLDINIVDILEIWSNAKIFSTRVENENLVMNGKLEICIFAINSNEEFLIIEKILDFEYVHPIKTKVRNLICLPNINIVSNNFRLHAANKIEIVFEGKLKGHVYDSFPVDIVYDIIIDEDKIKKINSFGVVLYFAEAFEKTWDIAKKYNTNVESIIKENELENTEVIESSKMLLIPIIT
jgi:hypothetical protein